MESRKSLGSSRPFTCPECNGTLWEIERQSMLRFRCHVGHAYTAEAVLSGRAAEVDKMLEGLVRSHQERAALVRRMAEQERSLHNERLARMFEHRANEYDEDAEVVTAPGSIGRLDEAGLTSGDKSETLRNEAAAEEQVSVKMKLRCREPDRRRSSASAPPPGGRSASILRAGHAAESGLAFVVVQHLDPTTRAC